MKMKISYPSPGNNKLLGGWGGVGGVGVGGGVGIRNLFYSLAFS